jgi:hypothetical protein
MVHIIVVGFLSDNHGRSCEVHLYECGNTLIEGRAMAWAIWFACAWWRKSTLHVILVKWMERIFVMFVLLHASMQVGKLHVCLMVCY